MRFQGNKQRNNGKFHDFASCRQPKCFKQFKIIGNVEKFATQINLYATPGEYIHDQPLVYQLRGEARAKLQEKMKFAMPNTVHEQLNNDMNKKLAKAHNNYQFQHSLSVLQKAKSEKMSENDRHTNDVLDIISSISDAQGKHPYIRQFVAPFKISLGCQEQVEFLKRNSKLRVHFDATGNTVKKPYAQSKRVYYYSGVVNVEGKLFPLMEYITNDHTTTSIRDFCRIMKVYWEEHKVIWPPFESFVTDWGWASINAIMGAWNNITVLQYLQLVFNEIQNNIPVPDHIMRHYLCYAHVMKMISKWLHSKKVQDKSIKLYLETIALIAHSHNLNSMSSYVQSLFTILESPTENDDVEQAFEQLGEAVGPRGPQIEEMLNLVKHEIDECPDTGANSMYPKVHSINILVEFERASEEKFQIISNKGIRIGIIHWSFLIIY